MNHERFYITDETVIEHIVSTQKQYFYAQKQRVSTAVFKR